MSSYLLAVVFCVVVLVGMLFCARLGHRIGRRHFLNKSEETDLATGVVDASVLSLLGLLTAFTFSSAYSRYDARRHLIVEEVNAIGTAALRLDLLPMEPRSTLRALFLEYVQSRHDLWRALGNREEALATHARANQIQTRIWNEAVSATSADSGDARKLLLPAINQMIDLSTTRFVAIQTHPPAIVFFMLGFLSLTAAWVVGFGMQKSEHPSKIHLFGFATIGAIMIYTIVDIEFPRHGFVTLDTAQQLFVDLETQLTSP